MTRLVTIVIVSPYLTQHPPPLCSLLPMPVLYTRRAAEGVADQDLRGRSAQRGVRPHSVGPQHQGTQSLVTRQRDWHGMITRVCACAGPNQPPFALPSACFTCSQSTLTSPPPPPPRCQGFRPILLRLYQEAGNPLRMKKVKELYAIKAKTARRARKESKRKSKRGKVPSVTC